MSTSAIIGFLRKVYPWSETRILNRHVPPEFATRWADPAFPGRQRELVDQQLTRLRRGEIDRVFAIGAGLVEEVASDGASILDAGCASGFYSEVFSHCIKARLSYTGIDLSPAMIELARTSYPNCTFEVASLTALPFADATFDIVFSSGAIVHVPDYGKAVSEVARVARRHAISHRMWVYPDGRPTQKFVEKLYGIEVLKVFMSERELQHRFQELGLRIVRSEVCLDAEEGARGPYEAVVVKSYVLEKGLR
jgi:SAM-dependent methyltransferase